MAYQGNLDGLCGPYSIVNALAFCGLAGSEQDLFEIACRRMAVKRWPELLWEGTGYGDLQRMIKACLESEINTLEISVSYPFSKTVPATNKDYWIRFDAIFDDSSVVCAIVGMKQPSFHWIVAYRDHGYIVFVDSDPSGINKRKTRASIHAGDRRPKATQWLIDRAELAVFKRP